MTMTTGKSTKMRRSFEFIRSADGLLVTTGLRGSACLGCCGGCVNNEGDQDDDDEHDHQRRRTLTNTPRHRRPASVREAKRFAAAMIDWQLLPLPDGESVCVQARA